MEKTNKVEQIKGSDKTNNGKGTEEGSKQLRSRVARLVQKLSGSSERKRPEVKYCVGLDLGDRETEYCIVPTGSGETAITGRVATTPGELAAYFKAIPRSRVAMEVGTHSPWLNELLKGLGHEVYVANVRKMEGGKKRRRRKNDRIDAERLARLVRSDPKLLYPIQHRGSEARHGLAVLRARDALVGARTKLIGCVRGLVKATGKRLTGCSTEAFHVQAPAGIPEELRSILGPIVAEIGTLTGQIREYDKQIERLAKDEYPETELCRQVKGVGPVTSLAYVLTLENPSRFARSRDVGPYLGLVPQQYESGDSSPQLRITKTGDRMLRRLLVGSAQYILGPFGEDCDLRRHGTRIAARGGKNAKKRAVVAVARKLAVLLHRLWTTGEVYEPLRNSNSLEVAEATS